MDEQREFHPFWRFSRSVSNRLLAWSGLSIVAGFFMMVLRRPYWRGVGVHFIVWGIIDAAIALFGLNSMRQKVTQPDADAPEVIEKEARNLSFLLWLNGGLDVFYVLGGLWVLRNRGRDDEYWRGQGIGIIIQGAFLFFFDVIHALLLPKKAK